MSNDRLKFRAWDDENLCWVRPKLVENESGVTVDERGYELFQWTGLYDSEGVEVYQGDIVKSGTTGATYLVCWSDEYSAWYKQMLDANVKDRPIYQDATFSRVIGNLHENPELLDA